MPSAVYGGGVLQLQVVICSGCIGITRVCLPLCLSHPPNPHTSGCGGVLQRQLQRADGLWCWLVAMHAMYTAVLCTRVLAWAHKPSGCWVPCRYAGAGLFDSVQSVEPQAVPVDYSVDQLFTDPSTQQQTLGRIALAAAAVEQAAGSAQDIEGVVTADGRVFIVQTRPQV